MVKSDISVLAYGLVVILIVVVIVLVVMLGSKCTRQRESFKGDKAQFNCAEDEFELTAMYGGSNVGVGCLKNKGGYNENYKRTNKIACGNKGSYSCQYLKYAEDDSLLACGCLEKMSKNDPRVILPEKFLK